jgi:signal transduction histidine kinase
VIKRRLPGGILFRLILINALIFSLGAGAVIILITLLGLSHLEAHLDESVSAELAILQSDYRIDGLRGLVGLIEDRAKLESAWHGRTYRLESADGRLLAGTFPHWPDGLTPAAGTRQVSVALPDHAAHWVMRAGSLPGGERLLVGFDQAETRQLGARIWRAAGWSAPVALLLAFSAALAASRSTARQIRIINQSARRIMDGDFTHRIPHNGSGDEIDRLTETLNQMLDRINELITATRSATDAIAHDLRSPLARLRGALEEALHHRPSNTEWSPWLHDQIDEIDRVLGSFSALLQLATVESGLLRDTFARVDLGTVVHDAASLYEATATERGQNLTITCPDHATPVHGDRNLLFQAVANLLDNAVKFSPPNAAIRVRLSRTGERWMLDVHDSGPGIAAEDRERVFERLFRHEHTRNSPGHGLGLSLVRAIFRLHGGDCVVCPTTTGAHIRATCAATPDDNSGRP